MKNREIKCVEGGTVYAVAVQIHYRGRIRRSNSQRTQIVNQIRTGNAKHISRTRNRTNANRVTVRQYLIMQLVQRYRRSKTRIKSKIQNVNRRDRLAELKQPRIRMRRVNITRVRVVEIHIHKTRRRTIKNVIRFIQTQYRRN